MLFEMAIADAYGMGFEYVSQEIVNKENDLKHYRVHGLYNELMPGQYTDDTQMSIALYEYLKQNKENLNESIIDKEKIADSFLAIFKRDSRKGYAKHFQKLLEEVNSGKELIEKIEQNGKTDSNGCVMRAPVIGLFGDISFIKNFAKVQSEITHKNTSIMAAQAVALSVFYFKNSLGKPDNLYKFLNKELNEDRGWFWSGARVGAGENLGLRTAIAAIHCATKTKTYSEALKMAVGFGGDTDSVAAIACAIVSVSKFHTQDIPQILIDGLENNEFGKDFLINLENL